MISCFDGKVQMTSPMGMRNLFGKNEYHGGIDLVSLGDHIVKSPFSGVARVLFEPDGFGHYVRLEMACGLSMYFGHMAEVYIKDYTEIIPGDVLGLMGATGRVTGAHTHIELRVSGYKTPLDLHYITGIPEKIGAYETTVLMQQQEAIQRIKDICGIEQQTIDYLSAYKYAPDLFRKIATSLLLDYS